MNLLKFLADEIFPENLTCHLCGREVFSGEPLCADCVKTVSFNNGATCERCGRRVFSKGLCLECKARVPLFDKAVSALVYEESSIKLIYSLKNGKPWIAHYLAELIAEKCKDFKDAQAICYVPMLPAAKRKRGYNQSYMLAKELSKLLNLPLLKDAVIKKKKSRLQKTLTRKEREENLKGCFSAKSKLLKGKNVILIDDVLTTGATAETVTKELKRRGALKVYFASVASVEYKNAL